MQIGSYMNLRYALMFMIAVTCLTFGTVFVIGFQLSVRFWKYRFCTDRIRLTLIIFRVKRVENLRDKFSLAKLDREYRLCKFNYQ